MTKKISQKPRTEWKIIVDEKYRPDREQKLKGIYRMILPENQERLSNEQYSNLRPSVHRSSGDK